MNGSNLLVFTRLHVYIFTCLRVYMFCLCGKCSESNLVKTLLLPTFFTILVVEWCIA